MMSDTFRCPNCGANVPVKAKACPECGSDEETGWSEAARYLHLLPDRGEAVEPSRRQWALKRITSGIAMTLVVILCFTQGILWGMLSLIVLVLILTVPPLLQKIPQKSRSGSSKLQEGLYQSFVEKARGDRALVDRLITYEQRLNPDGTRSQWLTDALDRWDRDRR
ncbi:MAG: hypothetical protein HC921_15570 [Synechococcaceae cyanobacterium SM2_3_1]|nr:hypothetical protein [Synechococcaceae cyanobacterium SM2_3_1]